MNSGTWSMVDPVVRDGHSAVMYRSGKILKTGTAADSGTTGAAANTAFVLDMTQPSPAWRQIANMHFPRAFQNSTILPDGTVLITGGGTALDGYDVSKGVLTPELWSPSTETWQTLAPAALARLYHSTALLLPDGRILIAGSGDDGPAVNQTKAELYSPPYLFKGARPTIAGAPDLHSVRRRVHRPDPGRSGDSHRGADQAGRHHPRLRRRSAIPRVVVHRGNGRSDGPGARQRESGAALVLHAFPGQRQRGPVGRQLRALPGARCGHAAAHCARQPRRRPRYRLGIAVVDRGHGQRRSR